MLAHEFDNLWGAISTSSPPPLAPEPSAQRLFPFSRFFAPSGKNLSVGQSLEIGTLVVWAIAGGELVWLMGYQRGDGSARRVVEPGVVWAHNTLVLGFFVHPLERQSCFLSPTIVDSCRRACAQLA